VLGRHPPFHISVYFLKLDAVLLVFGNFHPILPIRLLSPYMPIPQRKQQHTTSQPLEIVSRNRVSYVRFTTYTDDCSYGHCPAPPNGIRQRQNKG
jgi:hypothetical protein